MIVSWIFIYSLLNIPSHKRSEIKEERKRKLSYEEMSFTQIAKLNEKNTRFFKAPFNSYPKHYWENIKIRWDIVCDTQYKTRVIFALKIIRRRWHVSLVPFQKYFSIFLETKITPFFEFPSRLFVYSASTLASINFRACTVERSIQDEAMNGVWSKRSSKQLLKRCRCLWIVLQSYNSSTRHAIKYYTRIRT